MDKFLKIVDDYIQAKIKEGEGLMAKKDEIDNKLKNPHLITKTEYDSLSNNRKDVQDKIESVFIKVNGAYEIKDIVEQEGK